MKAERKSRKLLSRAAASLRPVSVWNPSASLNSFVWKWSMA